MPAPPGTETEPIVLHNQKCHFATNFDCLHIINSVIPLMMLSASHDAHTISNRVSHDQTSYIAPHIDYHGQGMQ